MVSTCLFMSWRCEYPGKNSKNKGNPVLIRYIVISTLSHNLGRGHYNYCADLKE